MQEAQVVMRKKKKTAARKHSSMLSTQTEGLPKIRGTLLEVLFKRIIVFWVCILGSLYVGKLPQTLVFYRPASPGHHPIKRGGTAKIWFAQRHPELVQSRHCVTDIWSYFCRMLSQVTMPVMKPPPVVSRNGSKVSVGSGPHLR